MHKAAVGAGEKIILVDMNKHPNFWWRGKTLSGLSCHANFSLIVMNDCEL